MPQIWPPFKDFALRIIPSCTKYTVLYIERERRGRGKWRGIGREDINFPFRLFSPPPSRLFGTATKATCWSSSVDSTKRRMEWKNGRNPPLSFSIFHSNVRFTSFACLMKQRWLSYVCLHLTNFKCCFCSITFLNICFISILPCYFYEICVVYPMIPP